MTATDTRPLPPVPTFPFSMFDPVHLGTDEFGEPVYVNLAERNMLLGGEPGGGKSSAENLIVAHGALSYDCRLVLVDGNQVQLGPWRHSADMFIGPSLKDATQAFTEFQQIMNSLGPTAARPAAATSPARRRGRYLVVIDEYAYDLGHHRRENRAGRLRRAGPGPDRPRPRRRGHPLLLATFSGPRIRSSTRPCGTCSPTGSRSAAPPTHPPMSCSARAGQARTTPPPKSTP